MSYSEMYKKTKKRRPRLVFWQLPRIVIHIFLKNHVDAGLKTGDDEIIELFLRTLIIWVDGTVTKNMTLQRLQVEYSVSEND